MKTHCQHSGRIERTPALRYLAGLKATVSQLWENACEHDGVSPEELFVVFSEDNPYMVFHNNAMVRYTEAMQQYQAGGYVGLHTSFATRKS